MNYQDFISQYNSIIYLLNAFPHWQQELKHLGICLVGNPLIELIFSHPFCNLVKSRHNIMTQFNYFEIEAYWKFQSIHAEYQEFIPIDLNKINDPEFLFDKLSKCLLLQ